MKKLITSIFILFISLLVAKESFAALEEFSGFIEIGYGLKLESDSTKYDDFNLLEQRFQLENSYFFEGENYFSDKEAIIDFKGDFTVDEYFAGKTNFNLRELNLSLSPLVFMDLKVGRQILTWGTGDYLFINDMFPKNYVSFFIGRDDEYLKEPSDALKLSFYPDQFNIDFIVMKFESNMHAKGDRLSFFDSFRGGIGGIQSDRDLLEPANQLSNNEYAIRLYRNLESNELALYYFRGFDKSPRSYKNEANRQLFYERLDVYGASIRGPFFGGIGNLELGYLNSRQDSDGVNRRIQNSMFKGMIGYSKDLGNDLNIGVQYYYEQIFDYGSYQNNLLSGDYFWDEHRHLFTQRLTKLFKNQTVIASLFNFYSPSDRDGYLRSSIGYDVTDQWNLTTGINIPWGEDEITEFGQMKNNRNIYLRLRYAF